VAGVGIDDGIMAAPDPLSPRTLRGVQSCCHNARRIRVMSTHCRRPPIRSTRGDLGQSLPPTRWRRLGEMVAPADRSQGRARTIAEDALPRLGPGSGYSSIFFRRAELVATSWHREPDRPLTDGTPTRYTRARGDHAPRASHSSAMFHVKHRDRGRRSARDLCLPRTVRSRSASMDRAGIHIGLATVNQLSGLR
jgi:hypothetical protein